MAPHVSRDAALDWLCVILPPGELPRSFAAGAQGEVAAAPARVIAPGDAARASAAAAARCSVTNELQTIFVLLASYSGIFWRIP